MHPHCYSLPSLFFWLKEIFKWLNIYVVVLGFSIRQNYFFKNRIKYRHISQILLIDFTILLWEIMHSLATGPCNLQVASGPRRARGRGVGGREGGGLLFCCSTAHH